MQITVILLLIVLAKKVLDFIKYAANGDINGAVTQFVAWAVGVATVYLSSAANVQDLDADAWQRVLWGMYLGSGASVATDTIKAIAKAPLQPPLLQPRAVRPAE